MSALAKWFKRHESKPLAEVVAEARANGHTDAAIRAAFEEYVLL